MRIRLMWLCTVAFAAGAAPSAGQIAADQYFKSVPLGYPALVRQTMATERFHLYGDRSAPGYRDQDPVDGIDDQRGAWLQQLAVRFAPIFVRNSPMYPVDFRAFYSRAGFGVHVDTWDLSRATETLLDQTTIPLGDLVERPCVSGAPASNSDCRLRDLIAKFGGFRGTVEPEATTGPEQQPFTLMYLDMPGYDEATWKAEYWSKDGNTRSPSLAGSEKVFVHPFIAEAKGESGEGFELVLQYWFFYPSNDAGNNHEGDWEHINVIVTPQSKVKQALDADSLTRLLGSPVDASDDPLVPRRIEYYLHHFVYPLDFSLPNAYATRQVWESEVRELEAQKLGFRRWIWERIRERAWQDDAETRVNPRPVVWIGGDAIGFTSALQKPGLRDRDGHASYPFRGYYKSIGPGTAERVAHDFDLRAYFSNPSSAPEYVEDYAMPGRVAMVPDWERVADLVASNAQARRDWGWLGLPLRFGFPASPSPGAGALPITHADLGNVSVVGPSFNGGWNRIGDATGYEYYDAIKESWATPKGTLDSFFPRVGWFNAPILFFLYKPPLDLAWRSVALPIRAATGNRLPTFRSGNVPTERLVSFEVGTMITPLSSDFGGLFTNRDQLLALAVYLAIFLPPDPTNIKGTDVYPTVVTPTYGLTFHLSPRFDAQSSFARYDALVGLDVTADQLVKPIELRGTLHQWDFHGSTRFNLMTGNVKPYLIYGGGITRYGLKDVNVNGVLLPTPDSPTFRPKGSWVSLGFNELLLGGGVDVIGLRMRKVTLGLKGSYTAVNHKLGFEKEAAVEISANLARELAGTVATIWRHEFRFQGTVGF